MFKDTKEGSTHYDNDGCGEPAHNCTCEEMTCKEGCPSKHTHKEFWCEKCHPERYEYTTGLEEQESNEMVQLEERCQCGCHQFGNFTSCYKCSCHSPKKPNWENEYKKKEAGFCFYEHECTVCWDKDIAYCGTCHKRLVGLPDQISEKHKTVLIETIKELLSLTESRIRAEEL